MNRDERSAGPVDPAPPARKIREGTDAVSGAARLPRGSPRSPASGIDTGRQFARFAGVGALATSVHYLLLVALVESRLAGPVTATAWGYLAGALVGYSVNRRHTFASRVRHSVGLPRFLLVAAVGFALNAALMAWMTASLGIHYLVAQVLATLLVLLWNFAANRHWTFGGSGGD